MGTASAKPALTEDVASRGHGYSSRLRVRSAAAFWTLLALAFVAPVAALMFGLRAIPDEIGTLSPPIEPLVVEAQVAEVDEQYPASGELLWTDGPKILAPAWSGLVTSVAVSVGDELTTGTLLARVDGVDRIAVASAQPFHRPLGAGDTGPDVAVLRESLRDLGYAVDPVLAEEYLDWRMASAIRDLEAKLAHVDAGQAGGTFFPDWFGWLPSDPITVYQVALEAGSPAPPAGEPVVGGPPIPAELTVTITSDRAQHDADERYAFIVGEAVVLLSDELTAEGEAVAALVGHVAAGAEAVEGVVRLSGSRAAIVVPIAAVQADPLGGHCVVVVTDDGYAPVPVVVTGGNIGTAEVASGLAAGTQVLANPAEVGQSCS